MPRSNDKLKPDPGTLDSEQALYMAKLAEAAERYDEMTEYMVQSVKTMSGDDLTVEQRNLISVGYKNLMSCRRTAWRVTDQQVQQVQHQDQANNSQVENGVAYKQQIAKELKDLITEVCDTVVRRFVEGPEKAKDTEVLVFFHKMEGDYNRYGAEISEKEEKKNYENKANEAYEAAHTLCQRQVPAGTAEAKKNGLPEPDAASATSFEDELPPTNPIRLGLALNFSVFKYEIQEEKEKASTLAKNAFDDAINKLDELNEEAYRDSTLIMQLLKDNLSLWDEDANHGDDSPR